MHGVVTYYRSLMVVGGGGGGGGGICNWRGERETATGNFMLS